MRIAVCDDNKAFLDNIAIKAKMYFETYDIIIENGFYAIFVKKLSSDFLIC